MAYLDQMEDKRPFREDSRIGWQTFKAIFDNLFRLRDAIRWSHDDWGRPITRQAVRSVGTYVLSAGKYQLQADDPIALLPDEITPSATGVFTVTFKFALPDATYDLQHTALCDSDKRPVQMGCWQRDEFKMQFVCLNTAGTANTAPLGFTIAIGFDGAV